MNYAKSKNVKVFYVTNRIEVLEESTKNNLIQLGLPFDEDIDVLLMKNENGWTSDKTARRELIAKDYRILLLFGDQLTDFMSAEESYIYHIERKMLAEKYTKMWGEKWFVITNPMYGRWSAIYNHMIQARTNAIEIRKDSLNLNLL